MIDYESEITKYGESLSAVEKEKARAAFNELLEQGRSFQWLYYAIQRMNGRSILEYPRLMFYYAFQEEVDALVAEAQEEARKKEERNREICAKIEAQILVRKEWERNMKIIFQPPKPKKKMEIDLAVIADTEDDEDGAMPQNERICLFEKTDSKNDLVRRVRGW